MPIRVKCGGCKKTLSVKDHLAGKKIKCPVCQTVVAVSASAPAAVKPDGAGAAPAPKKAEPPKKSGPAPQPGVAVKPPPDKSKSNGTPAPSDVANSNGVPEAPIELPPENIEAEALAAFADEPKPAEEEAEPQFIEYKCDWCDESVKQPMELAGKQAQCPNPECRRVVKVPLPKKVEKKDWRKMDRKGPAAAIINQPEALDDAWGTQDAIRARQTSLVEAGAVAEPAKRPVGAVGWMFRIFYGLCAVTLLIAVGAFGVSRFAKKQQHNARADAQKLVSDQKIKQLVLAAEAHRTIGLLYLREGRPKKARKDHLQGAQAIVALEFKANPKNDGVNEQLFLIELALSQIELGGDEKEVIAEKRIEWDQVREDLAATLGRIREPEVQAIALREVGTRLFEKNQKELAIGLSATLSNQDKKGRPIPFRQQIALRFAMPGGAANLKQIAKEPDLNNAKDLADPHIRVGYAEGYARSGDFELALKLAGKPGPAKDRLDAFLGIGAIAWQQKNKEQATECFTAAMPLVKDSSTTDWQKLQVVQLAARIEKADEVKDLLKSMKEPFRLRAHLEIVLAVCERSTGEVSTDALQELEAADAKDGTTLALAWMALARHNASKGTSRDRNRAIFEERTQMLGAPTDIADKARPMVDIGFYLGSLK
jgi:LSD1 subclass zinc finger protein